MSTLELHEWIRLNHRAGHAPELLLDKLLQAGWARGVALQALADALGETGIVVLPEPDLSASPTQITIGDRTMEIVLALRRPRLVVFRGFLSAAECDALIDAARPRLAPSTVVDRDSGRHALHAARVSDGMFFERCESPLIRVVEERIAELLRWPIERGETLQVLRYAVGGRYDPHFDYFDPALSGSAEALRIAGNRVGTFIMVLEAPLRGGATLFPDAGLEVVAQRGNAVFFAYDRPDPSTLTLHGGAPVLAGEKWIATKWLRERPFGAAGRSTHEDDR